MNENTPQDLLEIGRVGRSHGVKGEMYISLTSDRIERQQAGTTMWISGSAYVVQAIRPSNDRWLVFLEGIHSPEAAAALTNQLIFAEPIDDDDALWVHELVGSRVVGIHVPRCSITPRTQLSKPISMFSSLFPLWWNIAMGKCA